MKKIILASIFVTIMMAVFFQTGTAFGQQGCVGTVDYTSYYVGSWSDIMGCVYAGNASLGIGTQTPQARLHVVGETRLLGTARIQQICDQNGQNCKTVSSGWGAASNVLTTPNGQTNVVSVNSSSNVGVGTTNPQSKFAVNGTITAKEVKVTQTGWSDYVFAEDYRLLPLDELEAYVNKEKHLPDIPSTKEVEEKGLAVADMLTKQMQKIEELTLYLIQLKNENRELKERITALEEEK